MPVKHTFNTERLILRPLTLDDAEDYHRVIDEDPKNAGQVGLEQRRERIRSCVTNDQSNPELGWWAVCLAADGRFIGRCGLDSYITDFIRFADDPDNPFHSIEVELAYHIDIDLRRRGFAFEACKALIERFFTVAKLPRLVSVTSGDNIPSQALMKKLGFRLGPNLHPHYADEVVGILDNTLLPG